MSGNRFAGRGVQRWISTVVRLVLAGVLIAASLLKIADPHQAALAVQAYRILPTSMAEYVGYGLPLVELGLGVLLLLGLGTRLAALAAGALMTAFVVGVASVWARGMSIDCGCFGGGGAVSAGETHYPTIILRDVGFVLMAGWLVVFPASRLALDPDGRKGTGGDAEDDLDDLTDDLTDDVTDDVEEGTA